MCGKGGGGGLEHGLLVLVEIFAWGLISRFFRKYCIWRGFNLANFEKIRENFYSRKYRPLKSHECDIKNLHACFGVRKVGEVDGT